MKKYLLHIIFILFVLLNVKFSFSQSGVYIPSNGNIFFNGGSAGIFSDVFVKGTMGVGNKAVVNFFGYSWVNDPASLLSDEASGGRAFSGKGGTIRFAGKDKQLLNGGYNSILRTGPAFAKLQIDNPFGVYMKNGFSKVARELEFKRGSLFLTDQILVMGNGNPGKISGYNDTNFIVTGNAPGRGLLIREQISSGDGMVVFPIGTNADNYSPLGMKLSGNKKQDIYAGVSKGVKTNALYGADINRESVNTTWELGSRLTNNNVDAEIYLQHQFKNEGEEFLKNRDQAFVSNNNEGKWDTVLPQNTPTPAVLTTGPAIRESGINNRRITISPGKTHYLTKLTAKEKIRDTTNLFFSGFRMTPKSVEVYWITHPEVGIKYFIVTRRLSDENKFIEIDSMKSRAVNAYSKKPLRYSILDDNEDRAISYYQLISVDVYSERHYSNIIAVNGKPGGNELMVWPNPSNGDFQVGVNGYAAIKSIVIWDVVGRKVAEEAVNSRSIIPMHMRTPGTYLVGFISYTDQVIDTKKLIIKPRDY